MPLSKKSLPLSARVVYETLAVSAPTVLDAALGRLTREKCDRRLDAWSARVVERAAIDLEVSGRENMSSGVTYVVMSNHQSHFDVPVLYYVLGSNLRMVAKKELFELPIFGRALHDAGFVSVDRHDTKSAIASLEDAKRYLAGGTHIWIAPEGTRSPTGELLPFKKGGFQIALGMQAPILPISIQGTRQILPAKGALARRGARVTVAIHPAIATDRFGDTDRKVARDTLMREVRSAIEGGL